MSDEIPDFEPVHSLPRISAEQAEALAAAARRAVDELAAMRNSLAVMGPWIAVAMGASRNALRAGLEGLPAVRVSIQPAVDATEEQ